jgi:hypothetical protein
MKMRLYWLLFLFVPLLSLQSPPVYAMGVPENSNIGSVSHVRITAYSPQAIHEINQTISNDVNSPHACPLQKSMDSATNTGYPSFQRWGRKFGWLI